MTTIIRRPVNPYIQQRILRRLPTARFLPLREGAEHELGKTYLCGYWGQTYTVTAVDHDVPVWGTTVTVLWEDGRTTTHCTPLDPRCDYLIET